jgi:hypothetical protein
MPSSRTEVCPEEACSSVEHGGLAAVGTTLLLSEPQRQRVAAIPLDPASPPGAVPAVPYSAPANGRVYDVAAMGDAQFVVTTIERAPDGKAEGPNASATLQIGSLVAAAAPPKAHKLPGVGIPLGVAYSTTPERSRFYVADLLGDTVRWSYHDQRDGQLGPPRTFWTMKVEGAPPALMHMVLGVLPGGDEVVFAGGPDGLYLFHPDDGALLAKYILGRPVQGLSWGRPGELFMTTGRYLCVLRTLAIFEPGKSPSPAPPRARIAARGSASRAERSGDVSGRRPRMIPLRRS